MKDDSIKPVPGQPAHFKIWKQIYNAEPLLNLLTTQNAAHWAENIDQLMLLLVELNAMADNLDKELMYELYFDLRRLRDAFRDSLDATDYER